ncbi:hypothetical protein ACQUFY_05730 [Robbsia andropogonis]|uniref:hypothetical protein n=1 Tax=Robbsia andropogonis TaxID=28092 RepID=UPI003D25E2D3
MRPALTLACLGLLAGCAMTNKSSTGPHGRPVYAIDAMSSASMWDKAGKLCPNGYNTLIPPHRSSLIDWEMSIECN